MARLTIYLPNDVEQRFRREARRLKKSVSAYIASLGDSERPGVNGWPEWFGQLYGSMANAPLKPPADPTVARAQTAPANSDRLAGPLL